MSSLLRRLHQFSVFLALLAWATAGCGAAEQLVLAHYMPWFGAKPTQAEWGWHWTMGRKNPDRVLWEGQREIAAHDQPLIGPYDSGDPHVLECQVLLMKLAGLDGVIIDWYGRMQFRDYPAAHRHSESLLPWLRRAGLRFAICYEDQAVGHALRSGALPAEADVPLGKETLRWLDANWFRDPAYVTQDGRPLLLVFGPQHFGREAWREILGDLKPPPWLFALPHRARETGADGVFAWPPVADGRTVAPAEWRRKLSSIYSDARTDRPTVAVVFPGFRDYYAQAGVRASYGTIAPRDGATFAESQALARESSASLIQVATWNDYGEGTEIEPTWEFGYRYLEALQADARRRRGAAFRFTAADLRLPVQLFRLRQRAAGNSGLTREIDAAAVDLFSGQCQEADARLARASAVLGGGPATFADATTPPDPGYRLETDVLYRPRESLTPEMEQRCRLDWYAPAATGGSFATVVWFHGGGLASGERSIPLPLRQQRIAVAAANYRLGYHGRPVAAIEDAAAAVAWVFQHVAARGGSPEAVFVSGHSAGAYLALMVGLDQRWLKAHGISAHRIAGLIPCSPQVITHFAIRRERGLGEQQPVVDEWAPLFHVRKDAPPLLILTGDRERELMGRYEENAYFWRMLKIAGHRDVTLREIPGATHGGMPEPGLPLLVEFVRARFPAKH